MSGGSGAGRDGSLLWRKADRTARAAIGNRTLVCRGLEAESFLVGVHEMSMMDDDTQGGQVP
jgi:hypothetical protein